MLNITSTIPRILSNETASIGTPKLSCVRAGLSLPWSNGPVEGAVNWLKVIKRSMYGRAGFTLLKARVLHSG